MKSAKAGRPLLQLILTPSKGPIASTALVAMVKMGEPSLIAAEGVLNGSDDELVAFSKGEQINGALKDASGNVSVTELKLAETAHVSIAAEVLGALGGERSIPLLLAASDRTSDPSMRVMLSVILTQLPRNERALTSFKQVYEDARLDLETPAGPAKETMAQRTADFFDPTVAPWLVKTSLALKGDPLEVEAVRTAALVSAAKLMTEEQVAQVQTLFDAKTNEGSKVGQAFDKEFKQAKELVTKCERDINCLVTALALDANQRKDTQFTAIKAAYMIGLLGKERDRITIVEALPKIQNPAARMTALKALEALSPKGDDASADKLEALFSEATQSNDEDAISVARIYLQAAARLRSRAR